MKNSLQKSMEIAVRYYQAGYRKKRSVVDPIHTFKKLVDKTHANAFSPIENTKLT